MAIMTDMTESNREIEKIVKIICESVKCERIYLFGSRADGQPDESSDFDFYVVLPDGFLRPLEARRKIYRGLAALRPKKPVDIIANYAGVFSEMSSLPTLERQIAQNGILLYS